MKFAIVDIETTGGFASANGITEIAIIIHDGEKITDRYETLINPKIHIPYYIEALTGISNAMVANAPEFDEVAKTVYDLLEDKIFVAHSVNFDYSFVKHHLAESGYILNSKKLCTVRLGRKIFPGLPSYGLGKLCRSLNIPIRNRHRAGGDAEATAELFSQYLSYDTSNHIQASLNKNSKEQTLPPNVIKTQLDELPSFPGVYYFNNQKGKPVYIGKAKNLKRRVLSHFTGNNPGKQRQGFLKDVSSITYQECATELMALILEATEIKRCWPIYNRSIKRFEQTYGLYTFEDQNGYIRLAIDKLKKNFKCLYTFNQLLDGHNLLLRMVEEFELCPKLCFIQKNQTTCNGVLTNSCRGACCRKEKADDYNKRVSLAIAKLKSTLPSFVLIDKGLSSEEKSCILMDQGKFYGMGYMKTDEDLGNKDYLKEKMKAYPANGYIHNLILNFASRFPDKMIPLH